MFGETNGPSMDRRPAKIIFVGFEILLLLFVLSAQTRGEDTKITQLRKMYQDCVYDAVASEIRSSGHQINPSAATELAFQACLTEEQAILAYVYAAGVTQVQANQVMSSFRLSLKQTVRDIFARPEKYVPRSTETQAAPTPQDIPPPSLGCSRYKRYDGATVYINCPNR